MRVHAKRYGGPSQHIGHAGSSSALGAMGATGAWVRRCESGAKLCKFACKLGWPIDWPVRRKLARPKPSAPSSRVYAAFAHRGHHRDRHLPDLVDHVRRPSAAFARDRLAEQASATRPAARRAKRRSSKPRFRAADRWPARPMPSELAVERLTGRAARPRKPQHRRARALARRVVDRVRRQPYIYGEAASRPHLGGRHRIDRRRCGQVVDLDDGHGPARRRARDRSADARNPLRLAVRARASRARSTIPSPASGRS